MVFKSSKEGSVLCIWILISINDWWDCVAKRVKAKGKGEGEGKFGSLFSSSNLQCYSLKPPFSFPILPSFPCLGFKQQHERLNRASKHIQKNYNTMLGWAEKESICAKKIIFQTFWFQKKNEKKWKAFLKAYHCHILEWWCKGSDSSNLTLH